MPTYIGFSTINANKPKTSDLSSGASGGPGSVTSPLYFGKKYKIVDIPLVMQDFINALNIRQGEKPGNPGYGTTLWSFAFDPNTSDVQFALQNEIRRVASLDPRLILNEIRAYPQDNGILVEVELAVSPYNQPQTLNVFFNSLSQQAVLQ